MILWLIQNKNKTFGEIFGFSKTLYGDLKALDKTFEK